MRYKIQSKFGYTIEEVRKRRTSQGEIDLVDKDMVRSDGVHTIFEVDSKTIEITADHCTKGRWKTFGWNVVEVIEK